MVTLEVAEGAMLYFKDWLDGDKKRDFFVYGKGMELRLYMQPKAYILEIWKVEYPIILQYENGKELETPFITSKKSTMLKSYAFGLYDKIRLSGIFCALIEANKKYIEGVSE